MDFSKTEKPSFAQRLKRKALVYSSVFGILSSLYLVQWSYDLKSNFEPLLSAHRSAHVMAYSWIVDHLKNQVELVDESESSKSYGLSQVLNRFNGVQHFIFDQTGKLLFSSDRSERTLQQIQNEPWIWDRLGSEDHFLVDSFRFLRKEPISLGNLIQKNPKFLFSKTVNTQNGTLFVTISDIRELKTFALLKAKQVLGIFAVFIVGVCFLMMLLEELKNPKPRSSHAVNQPHSKSFIKSKISQKASARQTSGIDNANHSRIPQNTGKAFIRVRGMGGDYLWKEVDEDRSSKLKKPKTLKDLIDV